MITVDEKEVLRRKVLVDGMSIREVARQNGCSRETVKRALLDPSPSVYRLSEARKCPVMDPFREVIDEWLRGRPGSAGQAAPYGAPDLRPAVR